MWDGRFPRLHENMGEEKKFFVLSGCREVDFCKKNAGEGEKNARTKDKEGVGVGLKVMMRAKKKEKSAEKRKGDKNKIGIAQKNMDLSVKLFD